MYENWFKKLSESTTPKEWDPSGDEAAVFSDVLNDKISPKTAVDRLNGPSTQSKNDKENRAWKVWNMIYDAAADLPDAHTRILEVISNFDPIRMDIWRDFYGSLRKHDSIPSPERWINYSAFSAKLSHVREESGPDAVMFGFFAQRDALETHQSQKTSPEVCAAASWILYAGKNIYLADNKDVGGQWTRALSVETDLWRGPPGYNIERWKFWKERYDQMATKEDVTEEAKDFAKKAVDEMNAIEKINTSSD